MIVSFIRKYLVIFFFLFSFQTSFSQDSIDWKEVESEALNYFKDLIAINTTNPPGNETELANYLKTIFDKEGIDSSLYFNFSLSLLVLFRLWTYVSF